MASPTDRLVHRTSSDGWRTPCGEKIASLNWWMYIKKPVTKENKEEILKSDSKFLCGDCFDVKYEPIRFNIDIA